MSEALHHGGEEYSEDSHNSSEHVETNWMNDLEIVLEFSLGHYTLSLGELKNIGETHIFPINVLNEKKLVNIMIQGQKIGSGELVRVGKGLGLFVTELSQNSEIPPFK